MKREKKLSGMKSQSVNDRPLMDYAIDRRTRGFGC